MQQTCKSQNRIRSNKRKRDAYTKEQIKQTFNPNIAPDVRRTLIQSLMQ